MRLHPSVIAKLLQVYENYGGFKDEKKLKEQLVKIDLTPYERKSTDEQEVILVLTEDYIKALNGK